MPGPVLPKIEDSPLWPQWLRPENASVMDPAYRAPLRTLVKLLGLDDPNQVMAVGMNTMDVGPASGGLIDVLSKKYPRFMQAIKAYHGSPHDFTQFDTSKIGTGEGAQAYGHGLYFAENPAVAANYRKALTDYEVHEPSGNIVSSNGRAVTYKGTPQVRALAWVQDAAARNDIADPLAFAHRNAAKGLGDDPQREAILQQIKQWQSSGAVIKPGGRTYEVAITAHPDQFLDWDKPLSQQPESVRYMMGYKPPPTPEEVNALFATAKERGVTPASMPEYQTLQARADLAAKFDRDYPNGKAIYNEIMLLATFA
jgi:hypothetical protein